MAKFVSLKRSKSDLESCELQAHEGVLADVCQDDLPVIDFLNNYLQFILDSCCHENPDFYLRSHQFLSELEKTYRTAESQVSFILVPFLRSLLMLISETLFTSASSDICKFAVEKEFVTSPHVKSQLKILMSNLTTTQELTVDLESAVTRAIVARDHSFLTNQISTNSLVKQTEQIWKSLKLCREPLTFVMTAVENKGRSEECFFHRASLSVGAICAGRFLWSLWQGSSTEELVHAGLWSICTGMSGVVMQIPRHRAKKILDQLKKQKALRKELDKLLTVWVQDAYWSYTKMVLNSPNNGVT
ncbi:hypothetical protein CHS0354_030312 [Potamilus streckersoni]|uniref:Uncharacterized protein n=1 Tax=Potamilus streckersoni TaxID=2493646 RepID=A0AAE0T452_9BIVA|nr:hypothetical protein CHS0354_030312 [Potamilus streckersoni]